MAIDDSLHHLSSGRLRNLGDMVLGRSGVSQRDIAPPGSTRPHYCGNLPPRQGRITAARFLRRGAPDDGLGGSVCADGGSLSLCWTISGWCFLTAERFVNISALRRNKKRKQRFKPLSLAAEHIAATTGLIAYVAHLVSVRR